MMRKSLWLEGIFSGNSGKKPFSYQYVAYVVTVVLVSEIKPVIAFWEK